MPVFCIEVPVRGSSERGATYGCSRKLEEAIVALERGRRRHITWGKIVERSSAPRGMHLGEWLPPFDAAKHTAHVSRWTEAMREARRDLDTAGVAHDVDVDPQVRASIARDAYDSCQPKRSIELLAGIPPIMLGKTKYRVIHGGEGSFDLVGPRGGSSSLVRSRNDPNAWAHNTMSGHALKTVWYRRNPDFTFIRTS
jgi:hypothetical protein